MPEENLTWHAITKSTDQILGLVHFRRGRVDINSLSSIQNLKLVNPLLKVVLHNCLLTTCLAFVAFFLRTSLRQGREFLHHFRTNLVVASDLFGSQLPRSLNPRQ